MSYRADTEMTHDASLLVGPLLRYADQSRATIWVETDRPCAVAVTVGDDCFSASTWIVHDHHYALVRIDGLVPCTAHEYTVALDGCPVWPPDQSDFPPA